MNIFINKLKYRNTKLFFILTIFIFTISGCKIYSFSITSLPKEVKSYFLEPFISTTPNYISTKIIQSITNNLQDKLNGIGLINSENGDIQFKGSITKYKIDSKGEINEIQISLNIEYIDYEKKKHNFPITKFKQLPVGDSEPSQTIIGELVNEITEEIFNNTISKW